jgi:hypothetical protein
MNDFGVIVTCCRRDLALAKACCASVRYFLPSVPICLIVDGTDTPTSLVETYGTSVITRDTVRDADLRQRSFGWGLTKMIAFWESPWRRFLLLDADTVVWGDPISLIRDQAAEVVVDRHLFDLAARTDPNPFLGDFLRAGRATSDRASVLDLVNAWFFDTSRIEQHVPGFAWRPHLYDYFCSGALIGTRGIFGLDEYLEMLDLAEGHLGLFGPGEMGLLNVLVFRAADAGRIRVAQDARLQTLVCQHEPAELAARFSVEALKRSEAITEPTVIHWSGRPKPTLATTDGYADAMTFFRRRFVRDRRARRRHGDRA